MRTLFIAAEGYPIEWAQKIEDHWGCGLQEGYGSTQCAGFGGSTCDGGVVTKDGKRGLIHLFEWETLFEVVDPVTGKPTPSGEVGEMVITNLSIEVRRSYVSAPVTPPAMSPTRILVRPGAGMRLNAARSAASTI